MMTTPLTVYLMAGVATANQMFNECCRKLENMLKQETSKLDIHVLFPYGNNSRNLWAQVLEVGSDLTNHPPLFRIGGRKAAEEIKATYQGSGPVLLVGHSGGGAAAYQAAVKLNKDGVLRDFRVVQIGSPRIRVLPALKDRVSYFHAIDANGKLNDPISRIGSWGGWSRSGRRVSVPQWNHFKYAPGYVEGMPIVGGHADYFKHANPFVDADEVCNLDKTIDRIRSRLNGWI